MVCVVQVLQFDGLGIAQAYLTRTDGSRVRIYGLFRLGLIRIIECLRDVSGIGIYASVQQNLPSSRGAGIGPSRHEFPSINNTTTAWDAGCPERFHVNESLLRISQRSLGDISLPMYCLQLAAHDVALFSVNMPHKNSDKELPDSRYYQPNVKIGYPILNHPCRTLALLLPLITVVWIGLKYADKLLWRGSRFSGLGMILLLFAVAVVYAPFIINGYFIWQPWREW